MTNEDKYLQLYKRYRPNKWAALIGQKRVAASLRNDVVSDTLPTAYLFAGPRGCGKTSAAFILAKAINCEQRGEQGDPCNRCTVCLNIDKGTQLGVTYVSMANRGSVNDVRELVQAARLAQPVKRQIFILDEVHTISKQAFDALLIPLEDKSMRSIFIFCTTEIDRVPETITSRLQKRRFQLVDPDTMTKYIQKLAQAASIEASEEVISAAVRMGRGSVRDTLSALEEVLATGETSTSFGGRLLEAMGSKDLSKIYGVVAEAKNESLDFRGLTEQLFEDLRDLLLIEAGVERDLVGIPPVADEEKLIKALGGPRGIQIYLKEVGDAVTQMTMGADPRILLEMALFRGLTNLKRLAAAAKAAHQG